jgi:hypothetical protein
MGLLNSAAALVASLTALVGCYTPALRDCTVSCTGTGDCAAGQVCGGDHLCAAPEIAGRCAALGSGPGIDAGEHAQDAALPGDAASPDAPPDGPINSPGLIRLHVQISGKGSVLVQGYGSCSSIAPQHGDCRYDIARDMPQNVVAVAILLDERFTAWTSDTCSGQDDSCTFTPTAATSIVARFDHVGDR